MALTPNIALTPKANAQRCMKLPAVVTHTQNTAFKDSENEGLGLQMEHPGHPLPGVAGVQPLAATLLSANDVDAKIKRPRGREDARTYRKCNINSK